MVAVPGGKGGRSRDLGMQRHGQQAGPGGEIGQRIHLVAPTQPQHRSPDQQRRHIGAELARQGMDRDRGGLARRGIGQQAQHRGGIGRAAPQAGAQRNLLVEPNRYLAREPPGIARGFGGAERQVRGFGGQAGRESGGLEAQPAAVGQGDLDGVGQGNGLKHGAQLMKAVGASADDLEAEIDLGEGAGAQTTRHRGIGIPQTRQKQQLQWLARAQRGYPATAVTAPGRYPATAVTAPGRYAARPAYAAAPLKKRGRPARAGLGAHGPKPALRFAAAAPALIPGGGPPFRISQPFAPILPTGQRGATPAYGNAALTIQATKKASDSRYAKIVEGLHASEENRPQIRRLGDRLGTGTSPVVGVEPTQNAE